MLCLQLFYFKKVEATPEQVAAREQPCFIRAHLPEDKKTRFEVDQRTFEAAIER